MDLAKAVAELRAQRDAIDQAILSLEKLASANAGRPVRPARSRTKKRAEIAPQLNLERARNGSERSQA